MKITDNLTITKRMKDGAFYGEKKGTSYVITTSDDLYEEYNSFYSAMRQADFDKRTSIVQDMIDKGMYVCYNPYAP